MTGEIHRRHHVSPDGFYRGRQVVTPRQKKLQTTTNKSMAFAALFPGQGFPDGRNVGRLRDAKFPDVKGHLHEASALGATHLWVLAQEAGRAVISD